MRTVGIITFHSLFNLGAVLQAFALQRTIESLGNSCQIIDFRRSSQGTPHHLFCLPLSRGEIKHDLSVFLTLPSRLEMRRRFNEFRKRHLVTTPSVYDSVESLGNPSLHFDVYVTGSDMVWNPTWLEKAYAPVYYLDFVKSGRRVSFAPSFACTEIPAKYRDRVANYLRAFDHLSCREDAGCDIVRDLTGREAEHVLDPTLLQPLSEYAKMAIAPALNSPCILVYPMHQSDDLREVAMRVKRELNLPIVAVVPVYHNPRNFRFADQVVFTAGPGEFLGWMQKAAFVCTNSFHGAAFSIIHRKNFLTVPALGSNTRSQSMLKQFGLLSRQVNNLMDFQLRNALPAPIDYASVEVRLKQAIEKSTNYLKKALA